MKEYYKHQFKTVDINEWVGGSYIGKGEWMSKFDLYPRPPRNNKEAGVTLIVAMEIVSLA